MLTPVSISTGRMSRSVLPSSRCMGAPPGSVLDVDLLEPEERPSEKARSDLAEPVRRVGYEEVVLARGRRSFGQKPPLEKPRAHDRGGRPRRIDQHDAGADRLADDPFEEWIVRAAEDQRVDPFALEVLKVQRGGRPGHLIIHPTLLGERHEQRAGAVDHPGLRQVAGDGARVGAALDGGGGADDTDDPPARGAAGRLGPRTDDADYRDLRVLPQLFERQ